MKKSKVITIDRYTRGGDDVRGLVSEMLSENLISGSAAQSIKKIEEVLNDPEKSVEEMDYAITQIQKETIPLLSGDDLSQFMAYAETAKASLVFWDENYDELSYGIRGERSVFKRIAMAAASDAAGAAAGAAFGASIAGKPGAIAGGTVAGAASSAAGWKSKKLSIVIPFTKIIDEINRK